jgi:adenylate cyclase
VIFGLQRLRLVLIFTAIGLVLHVAAWMLFPRSAARIPVDDAMLNSLYVTASFTTITMIAAVVYYAFRLAEDARAQTEALLRNILPDSIVNRLTDKPDAVIADSFEEASVLFADLKGFVPLAKTLGPERTVGLLNEMMRSFDRLAAMHGVEKIKTIGDAYMVAAGVPEPVADHAPRLARMGLAMLQATEELAREFDAPLHLRIGIASGPVMAGVIGAKRLTYDVWGDTVNLASRLEGQSTPGRVLVASATKARLDGLFQLEPRGALDIKGLGEVEAWFLGPEEVSDPPGQIPLREVTQIARSRGV